MLKKSLVGENEDDGVEGAQEENDGGIGRRRRVRKEFERHKTGSWGRGDGSFVTVRSVCFSFITARTRSGPQPSPAPPRS